MSKPTMFPPSARDAIEHLHEAHDALHLALGIAKLLLSRLEKDTINGQDRRKLAMERLRASVGTLTLAVEDVVPDAIDHLKHVSLFISNPTPNA